MKKFFIIVSVALLLIGYHLIPAEAPVEDVLEWLASEVCALALLYFTTCSIRWAGRRAIVKQCWWVQKRA